MELFELVRQAQEAMDRGDYQLATAACAHAIETYPSCLSAHRMLGESYLEQGVTDRAVTHFERALQLDPLNVVAHVGLGVAAEERNDLVAAYTHYLRAWDLNPVLDQLRDELVRLRGALGSAGKLHPTRGGLASIFVRSGQLGRATTEWRAVLAATPESQEARLALAALLWTQGDDAGAAALCRETLKTLPDNARALALLADIERRRGDPGAGVTAERYRTIDPTGVVASALAEERPDVDLSFLFRDSAPLDDFAFAPSPAPAPVETPPPAALPSPIPTAPSGLSMGHLPAPDLWDNLVRDMEDGPADLDDDPGESLRPFEWPGLGAGGQADQHDDEAAGARDLLAALEPIPAETMAPAAPASPPMDLNAFLDAAAHDLERDPATDLAAAAGDHTDPPGAEQAAAPAPSLAAWDVAPATWDVAPAAPEPAAADIAPATPAATPPAAIPSPAPAASVDQFVTADGRIDLTAGWDDLDRVLAEATPTAAEVADYQDLVAELDQGGLAPFAVAPSGGGATWEPLGVDEAIAPPSPAPAPSPALADSVASERPAVEPFGARLDDRQPAAAGGDFASIAGNWDDVVGEPAAATQSGAELSGDAAIETDAAAGMAAFADSTGDAATLAAPAAAPAWDLVLREPEPIVAADLAADTGGWDEIDEDLAAAIPSQQPSGYTEIFRNIDSEGIETLGDESALADDLVDPLANPDAVGEPLDFEDLLAVTSQDGTSPLSLSHASPAPGLDRAQPPLPELPFAALPAADAGMPTLDAGGTGIEGLAGTFEGLEPFAFVDRDGYQGAATAAEEAVNFSEIDDLSFDPAAYAAVPDLGALHRPPAPAMPAMSPLPPLPALDQDDDLWAGTPGAPAAEAIDALALSADDDLADVATPWRETEPDSAIEPAPVAAEPAPAEVGPATVEPVVPSAWPSFIAGASEFIDRASGGLFERLRTEKRALIELGNLAVERSVSPRPSLAMPMLETRGNGAAPAALVNGHANGAAADHGLDLVALREQLKRDPEAADEVASTLEGAVADGFADPLLLRVLGEAYLKLGRSEQAAAQFRQALVLRGKGR